MLLTLSHLQLLTTLITLCSCCDSLSCNQGTSTCVLGPQETQGRSRLEAHIPNPCQKRVFVGLGKSLFSFYIFVILNTG